jgi:hypothetical protein
MDAGRADAHDALTPMADCGAVSDIQYAHHYTNNSDDTCRVVLSAGVDIGCDNFLPKALPAALQVPRRVSLPTGWLSDATRTRAGRCRRRSLTRPSRTCWACACAWASLTRRSSSLTARHGAAVRRLFRRKQGFRSALSHRDADRAGRRLQRAGPPPCSTGRGAGRRSAQEHRCRAARGAHATAADPPPWPPGALPLSTASARQLAVVGPNADATKTMLVRGDSRHFGSPVDNELALAGELLRRALQRGPVTGRSVGRVRDRDVCARL